MAILCRELGLLFILNPATGSTATGKLLRERFGGEWLPSADQPGVPKKHSTLRELLDAGLLSTEERARLCVVTTVRNPYDRLVSIYAKRRGIPEAKLENPGSWVRRVRAGEVSRDVYWVKANGFPAWIRRRFVRNWALRTALGRAPSAYDRFVDGVDVVLRYERLQEDFDALIRRLGAEPAAIPRFNESRERKKRDYRTEYDVLSRWLVRVGQRTDLDRFCYAFDPAEETRPSSRGD